MSFNTNFGEVNILLIVNVCYLCCKPSTNRIITLIHPRILPITLPHQSQCQIEQNTPLVSWCFKSANSVSWRFRATSWTFRPMFLECSTNFMNLLDQFMILLNRLDTWHTSISWLWSFPSSNFLNLPNMNLCICGDCDWSWRNHCTRCHARCLYYRQVLRFIHIKIIHILDRQRCILVDNVPFRRSCETRQAFEDVGHIDLLPIAIIHSISQCCIMGTGHIKSHVWQYNLQNHQTLLY